MMKDALTTPHPIDKDFEFLQISQHPSQVVVVALHRPRRRNALHAALWKEIRVAFTALGQRGDCRAIMLMGEGPSFCAGIDITDPSFLPSQAVETDDVAHLGIAFAPKIREMQACFTALETCLVPVVAAIHGNCIGAGVDMICAADVRLASADAILSVREVALGLAADIGTLQRLPRIVGNDSLVRELCLSGRKFTASEAVAMGLVHPTLAQNQTALFQSALKLCTIMAQHSPVAVRGTKQALVYARDHSVADGLEQIASYNSLALQSRDLERAWTARSSSGSPDFADLPPQSRL